jgi:chromosome segregation ATPase
MTEIIEELESKLEVLLSLDQVQKEVESRQVMEKDKHSQTKSLLEKEIAFLQHSNSALEKKMKGISESHSTQSDETHVAVEKRLALLDEKVSELTVAAEAVEKLKKEQDENIINNSSQLNLQLSTTEAERSSIRENFSHLEQSKSELSDMLESEKLAASRSSLEVEARVRDLESQLEKLEVELCEARDACGIAEQGKLSVTDALEVSWRFLPA